MILLDRILEQKARGEPVRPEELLADRPDLAGEGAALLLAVEGMEALVASVLEHSGILRDAAQTPSAATEDYQEAPPEAVQGMPDPAPDEYRVRKFLGEGRFSQVWLADHVGFGMPVALKTLHLEVSGPERALALAALHNEARILARLQHPNVVRVYDLFQAGGEHYLVLQYVAGGSLQARLEKHGPLAWQLAARYVADVGEALLHVHKFGVVHCDVKPANLLWDRQRDEALLTDFGLASRLANSGRAAGTPLYMAPEAFAGRSTPAGDVYGLAASLYALMTGRVPFPAATRAELLERIHHGLPDPELLLAGVPWRLEQVIRSGLAGAPGDRPELSAFVADLRGSLNRLLADSLILPAAPAGAAAPVDLRLTVSRWDGAAYVPLAGSPAEPCGLVRDMTIVPPPPEHIGLRTGDRVRVEVTADRDGFVTVFNVGPTGHLNLLYPDPATTASRPPQVPANRPLHVTDVALTPPAGNERLFAVWSRIPFPLEEVVELTRGDAPLSPSYRATRNMERVQESVQRLRREDWHAVVLELDHTDL
jgi:serine/threonine protein kinase